MSRTATIQLSEPIIGHSGPINAIVLREPTFDEYIEHGDPYTVGETEGGARFAAEKPETIRAYLDACIVEPKSTNLLSKCGVKVAKEVKAALIGFFRDEPETAEGSTASPTTSSSAAT